MNNQVDSILIKDTRGQFKTVSLGVAEKKAEMRKASFVPPMPMSVDAMPLPRMAEPWLKAKAVPAFETKSERGAPMPVFAPAPAPQIKINVAEKKPTWVTEEKKTTWPAAEEKNPPPIRDRVKEEKAEDLARNMSVEMAAPGFYISLDDEKDAERFKNKEQIRKQEVKEKVINYSVAEALKQSGLSGEADVSERLRRVIESRLREVRNLLETRENLTRPLAVGGVGLSKEQAQQILKIIENKRVELETKSAEQILADLEKEKMAGQPVTGSKPEPVTEVVPTMRPKIEGIKSASQPSQEDLGRRNWAGIINQEIVGRYAGAQQPVWSAMPQSMPFDLRKMEARRKIMGPVEELASFGLDDFRALAPDALSAAAEIKEKIKLLQEESFEKRAEGISAWRSSPVYHEYLALGRESMELNQGVEQVILNRQRTNRQTLTAEEFQAVADLNEEIAH